jgi:CRP/FNR family transcriptional regulator, cyclic AMP receptor protein
VERADPAARDAIARSVFGQVPPNLLATLLEDYRDTSVAAGHRFMGADQPAPYRTGLVVEGLLRMYVGSEDGRQVTFRYAGPGYFLGAAATVARMRGLPPPGVEAVTDARLLYLNQTTLRSLARSEATVAWALLEQMVTYQVDLIRVLAGTAFGSVRERTAMHLLGLASKGPEGAPIAGALVAAVTQQTLADAVGTTRETVARALGELRELGLISTVRGGRGGVLLRDPEGLAAEAERGSGVVRDAV